MKPVLFVSNHAPPDRTGAFARLHAREDVVFALFGGRLAHGPGLTDPGSATRAATQPGFPRLDVSQRELFGLASSGRYRAVVCGTNGRLALPAAWLGARRAGVPFLLWATLWAHPATAAHAASYPLLLHIYASADAVVTYGLHVSAYVRSHGARNVHIAPQAVDNDFWSAQAAGVPDITGTDAGAGAGHGRQHGFTALFAGRSVPEKGLKVLTQAWGAAGLAATGARLVLAGVEPDEGGLAPTEGVTALGALGASQLRNLYGRADVLVMPSIRTRTFREPWGLVSNEAFNQRLPIIASDAVGAVAGGLVRHERNGLVVRAGSVPELTAALVRINADAALRERLGEAGGRDVAAFTQDAWAAGFSAALLSVSAAREPC